MADLESMLAEGQALEERRHFEEAIAVYSRARSSYPTAGGVHLALGRVYARERRYPEAVNAYFQAGSLLLDGERPEEAQRAYSALIGLEKELAAGYSPPALQRIHSRRGDVAHGMARILYLKGAHEQALRLVSTALESEPTHIGMRTTLGLLHQDAGREDEALEHYQAVVKMHRGNLDEALCHERLAPLLARRGAPATTVHQHYYDAALFYKREGKLEKALPAYEAAVKLAPQHEATLIHAADLLLLLGRTEHADNLLSRLEPAGEPKRWKVVTQLEALYTQAGRAEHVEQLVSRVAAVSGLLVVRHLVPEAELVLPNPVPAGQPLRRIPALQRERGAVRLDFPAVAENAAGSVRLQFHPELQTNQDVLRHMCELLQRPAEQIVPQVRSGKVSLGEVVRLATPSVLYDYVFVPGGVLSVQAATHLPALDWSKARLAEPGSAP